MEALLCDLAREEHTEDTFNALLSIVKQLGKQQNDQIQLNLDLEYDYPNEILLGILNHISRNNVLLLLLAKACNAYTDLLYYTLRNMTRTIQQQEDHGFFFVLFSLLRIPKEGNLQYWIQPPSERVLPFQKYHQLKALYTDLVLELLPRLRSEASLKKTLLIMDKHILPHVTKPLALADFFSSAFRRGGSLLAILSLRSLFVLMRQHNLNYADFYPRLYSLLSPEILADHVPYRTAFLKQLRLYLSSTMLPASTVAAFIKKLLGIAILVPSGSLIAWVLPFIYNLLLEHPLCRALVHREATSSTERDPFKADETDPSKADALDSSLWELHVLQRHYSIRISRLVEILGDGKFARPPYDLDAMADDLEGDSLGSLAAASDELEHRWSRPPPIQVPMSETLF